MAGKGGFGGLGIMGVPMACNFLDAGHDLVVHNRSRGRADALAAKGAEVIGSPGGPSRGAVSSLPCFPDRRRSRRFTWDQAGCWRAPGGKIAFHRKDLGIALAAGR